MTDADQIETCDGSTSSQRETEVNATTMGDLCYRQAGTRVVEGLDAARVQGGES